MSRARDAALFTVMTAASAFAALTGEPVLGLAGVLLFGGGGAVHLLLSRDAAGSAPGALRHLPGVERIASGPAGTAFPARRGAMALAVAGAVVFLVVAVLFLVMALHPGVPPPRRFDSPAGRATLAGIGGITLLVFGTFAAAGLNGLRPGNGIVLLQEGVCLRSPAGRAWVRWEDLAEVRHDAPGTPGAHLALLARSPDAVALTGLNRLLQRSHRRGHAMDVGYPSRYLRTHPDVVVAEIERFLHDPGARRELGSFWRPL